MAGRKVSAIKIKDLRYAEVLSAAPTLTNVVTSFKAATKIDNSHQETFTYEEDEPTVTQYKNELTNQLHHRAVRLRPESGLAGRHFGRFGQVLRVGRRHRTALQGVLRADAGQRADCVPARQHRGQQRFHGQRHRHRRVGHSRRGVRRDS